ncbi:MAG: class II fructose-1,6-bisphosphate aldolase [Actinobacteria bacterium]|nr:class II fructose-1,6-bisphosphate aldolase [Actinomycetota bacterium]
MPLVTSKEILRAAYENHYGIGAFNANNMEIVQAIVNAAMEERAPVILQISQGAIKYAGLYFATGMVKIAAEEANIPVVLHLDHGTDFEQNIVCLRAGFTSLMFDGSKRPYEENVEITRKVVEIAHACGIPVEGELGRIVQITDGYTPEQVEAFMANPDQAADFVERTGIDSLAPAIGSVHAMRTQSATLDIERLKKIKKNTAIPLVLHGSSGVTDESIVKSLDYGISKINVDTHLRLAFVKTMRKSLADMPDEADPRKILAPSRDAVKEAVREKIKLFRSNNTVDSMGGLRSPARSFSIKIDENAPE